MINKWGKHNRFTGPQGVVPRDYFALYKELFDLDVQFPNQRKYIDYPIDKKKEIQDQKKHDEIIVDFTEVTGLIKKVQGIRENVVELALVSQDSTCKKLSNLT